MNIIWFFIVFASGELLSTVLFVLLHRNMGPEHSRRVNMRALMKGMLERLLLFAGLAMGYPHIIIAFGAFKLGTRLHDDKGESISNDYFLIGNFLSLLIAMSYIVIYSRLI